MRSVNSYFRGSLDRDGAGVSLRRVFGYQDLPDFDPFLMMDFFDSTDPKDYIKGFPFHPHRGIETITYLVSGEIIHRDSLGNEGRIGEGQCQWMSAGSGIYHEEMPQESDLMLGTQIWLNMEAQDKMNSPEYRDITEKNIGLYREEGLSIRIIAGEYKGVRGPINRDRTKPIFFDLELEENSQFNFELDQEMNLFAFLLRGEANFQGDKYLDAPMGILYNRDGDRLVIKTGDKKARIFLLAGQPLGEEIAWGGPIVMNTRQELEEAFRELNEGTFIK